jgi:glycosyltransferase involved in cell wall biosynthesis
VFESYKKIFKKYDLVIIKQADTANVAKLIGACKELQIPIVMDLDDLITELDEDNPALMQGYKKGEAKQAFAIASLSMVDGLFVSTQPLAEEYKRYLKTVLGVQMPVYVLPNCCDPSLWNKRKRIEGDTNIVLGWQGSITHDGDLAIMMPAVKKLMAKYPNLHLNMTGGVRQETYDKMFVGEFPQDAVDRIMINQGTQSFKNFPEYLSRHQWDIGVIPLRDTKFTRGKSHIKWLENSLIGVCSIASDVYPYRESVHGIDTIVDGKTGILCKDDEWEEKLDALISDSQTRKYLARDARKYVIENWKYSDHVKRYEKALASVMKHGSRSLR